MRNLLQGPHRQTYNVGMVNHRLKISPEVRARIIAHGELMDSMPTIKELAREVGLTPRQVDGMICANRLKKARKRNL